MIGLEFIIVLGAIFLGTRLKGLSLGLTGGLGLVILTFVFNLKPTSPPFEVLLIITAVVTAASTLDAAGGLEYLSHLAEKAIKKSPQQITFIAPLITYMFTFLAGTGHIVYSILPVIATVARETGIRPERPLTTSVIAAQQAAIASPISAPTAILLALLAPYGIELHTMLSILLPSTLGGMLLTTLVVNKMGKNLQKEPGYQAWLASQQSTTAASIKKTFSLRTKTSVGLFLGVITVIIFLGACKTLRPSWILEGRRIYLDMPTIIAIIMLGASAIIVLVCKVNPLQITKTNVFSAGIQAVVSILGISWLGDTFVQANQAQIMQLVQAQIEKYPWQFSLLLFLTSILLVSQTATIRALIPLGITLGIPIMTLLALTPAVNGLFFMPNYPTILAAVNLDRTGTTKIGKYVINHSFMIPGLLATSSAVGIALLLVHCFY